MLRRSQLSVRVIAAARSAATKSAAAAPAAAAVKPAASFNATEAAAATSAAVRQGVDAWQREQQQLGGFTISQDLNGIGAANGVHTARLSQKQVDGTTPLFAAREQSSTEIGWVWVMPVLATVACWLWTHDFVVLYADWLTCEGNLNVYSRRAQLEQQMDKEAAELAKKERLH